jgi:DNA-binding MarR family transcriptional regulator
MRRREIAAAAMELERDLRAVRQILRRPLEAEIARGRLTGPQQSAMQALVQSGAMSLKDLSRELGLAHSTVSGIVDRLQSRGLVEREPDHADRRISKITASDLVREYVRKTIPALETNPLAQALRSATPSERKQVREGVRILRELLERESSARNKAE